MACQLSEFFFFLPLGHVLFDESRFSFPLFLLCAGKGKKGKVGPVRN